MGLGWVCSTLLRHVSHVLGVRTKKQVCRVDARRVVAPVAHAKASLDGSKVQFPRVPVSLLQEPSGLVEEVAVPSVAFRGSPRPAFFGAALGHLGPESLTHSNSPAGTLPTI